MPAPEVSWVELARVVGVHGVRGELRLRLAGGDIENLKAAPRLRLASSDTGVKPTDVRVRSLRPARAGEALLALEGVDDRDAARALTGRILLGEAEHLEELAEGEYYQFQLVGCSVADGNGRVLGVVREIWETGAPDVLVVRDGASQHLIPAVFVRQVDLEAREIVIEAPPGLLDPEPGR